MKKKSVDWRGNRHITKATTTLLPEPEPPTFRIVPNRGRLIPGVSPHKLNQLNDQLEIDDFSWEGASNERG